MAQKSDREKGEHWGKRERERERAEVWNTD